MDLHLPLGHLLAIQLIIFGGYGIYILFFYGEFTVGRYSKDEFWSSCTNGEPTCNLSVYSAEREKMGSLMEKGQPFRIHFKSRNLSSQQMWTTLKHEKQKYAQIVWSDSSTVPPYIHDNRTHVEKYFYSLKTLKKSIPDIAVEIEYGSLARCISKAQELHMKSKSNQSRCTVPMFVLSLANAFFNIKIQGNEVEGAVCHLDYKYTCCKKNDKNEQYTCSSYNPWMIGIFYTTLIITAFAFCCFPAISVRFPDEKDSSETISANTQVSNPLYRIVNCAANAIRYYSAEYYFINMIRKLSIGFALPILFYINWGFIESIIDNLVTNFVPSLLERKNIKNQVRYHFMITILIYGAVVIVISMLPRTDSLDFSLSPAYFQKMVKYQRGLILNSHDEDVSALDLMKSSWSLIRTFFIQFSFGFKGWADGRVSLCRRIINFVFSCVLIVIVFPVIAVYILIGYCLYILPLGRQISILFCYADIYFYWFAWRLTRLLESLRKSPKKRTSAAPNHALFTVVRVIGLLIMLAVIWLFFLIMISYSLQIFSNVLIHLYIGILANRDELFPIIALASMFMLYMWDSCSSVGNDYKSLLEMTFNACKQYQQKEKHQVIKFDKNGIPRIHRLSDLFQNICDKIQPFKEKYTAMCLKMFMIALLLSLTYCCISVFGQSSVSKMASTVAIILGGLIAKLIDIFKSEASERLENKEKASQIMKIVHDFFSLHNAPIHESNGKQRKPKHGRTHKGILDGDAAVESPSSNRKNSQLDVATVPSKVRITKNEPSAEEIVLLPSHPSTMEMGRNYESSI